MKNMREMIAGFLREGLLCGAAIVGGALLFAEPAQAEPIYLTCTFMADDRPFGIDFTADEAAGTVSILIKASGSSRTVSGAFTPDRVLVNERDVRWNISRTDLSVIRTIKLIDSDTRGQCELQKVPQRAF